MMSQLACGGVLGEGETTTGMGWMDGVSGRQLQLLNAVNLVHLLFFGCFVVVIFVNLLIVCHIARNRSFSFQVIT
jgi:hypothetical protein